jgi:light-regulated signal transduction histidine kinase (bacteriophytochrome)
VDGAQRMQGLIKDLLKFSRVGTRGKPFELMELSTALENALFNLKVAIEENNTEITNDELPVADVDSTQIVQLLQNLIGNAIKFKRKDVPSKIHIGVTDKGSYWQIAIKDNGIGIDPQFAERVFGIFQRLQTRDEYPGTGIGLAVCKKIVERHGGKIWVESVPDEGATFHFTLPKNH